MSIDKRVSNLCEPLFINVSTMFDLKLFVVSDRFIASRIVLFPTPFAPCMLFIPFEKEISRKSKHLKSFNFIEFKITLKAVVALRLASDSDQSLI